jgi:hypothetical protein
MFPQLQQFPFEHANHAGPNGRALWHSNVILRMGSEAMSTISWKCACSTARSLRRL